MTKASLSANCSNGEGRHIGKTDADLTYKYFYESKAIPGDGPLKLQKGNVICPRR